MSRITSACLLFSAWALFYSCAIKVAPQGGKTDKDPPKILSSQPEQGAVNYRGKTIVVEFDEFIQLSDLQNQLVISPLTSEDPVVEVKKKSVHIKLPDSLQSNTTYVISLGNSIVDIHENNPYPDFRFVFSTGPSIDSTVVSGTLKNAFTHLPEKKTLVMLYLSTGDSVPINERPVYYARTGDTGEFRLAYLAPGNYKVFALGDKNNNHKFDLPNEPIAFTDTLADSRQSPVVSLFMFTEDKEKQRLLRSSYDVHGKIQLAFARPAENLRVTDPGGNEISWMLFETFENRDTIQLWPGSSSVLAKDTFNLIVSAAGMENDTIRLSMKTGDGGLKKKQAASPGFFMSINASDVIELNKPLELSFSQPVEMFNPDSLQMLEDSVAIKPVLTFYPDSLSRPSTLKVARKVKISFVPKEKAKYKLTLFPGAAKSYLGVTNDTTVFEFRAREVTDYGTLNLTIAPPGSESCILQLLDEKDAVVRQVVINTQSRIPFRFLLPGKYRLKLILDQNKNGKWDTGSYLMHVMPEKIYFFGEAITVKSDWELEQVWNP